MAIKIFGSIGFGTAIGYFLFRNMDTAYVLFNGIGQIVIIGLCVLLFFVGTTVGIKGGIWEYIKKGGSNLIIFPMAGIIGTLLGTGICSIFIGMNPTEGMAVGAGFGWYTIAPVLMESHSAELSALSFIHNLLRVFVFCKPQILKIAKKNPHPHLGKFSLWRLSFSPCCLNHRRAGCNYGAQVCLS